jgi:membrane protease YdiL (CAAX protease family)
MPRNRMIWRPAPGWPEAPPGWQPPPGWSPPADWPPAPSDWAFWAPEQSEAAAKPAVRLGMTRAGLVLETRLVMIAGLFPWIAAAVVILAKHVDTGQTLTQLPSVTPHQPVLNVILSVLSYLPSASIVPLVLLLLMRTGQRPADLGLTRLPGRDLGVAVGLAAAALGLELVLIFVLKPLEHSRALNTAGRLDVPAYYLLIALSVALTTAVAEEVIVNGYLITRLEQLGWSPAKAFWLSMGLRASYHLYYGVGVLLTLPFGWLATRSFQKHRRLNRPILAHFLYDGTVSAIAILIAGRH